MINKLGKNNYKEKSPVDTVGEIREVLRGVGFDVVEVAMHSGVGAYAYGLDLLLDGFKVTTTSGKGNTEEFALASAYGEMIERLQCDPRRIFRQYYNYYNSGIFEENKDFVNYYDDYKVYDMDEYKKNDEYLESIYKYDDGGEVEDIINKFVKDQYNTYGYIPLAKFTNFDTGGTEYINEHIFRQFSLGSTGYCAGNSKYEALTQGISEIIERYVKLEVIKNKMCLPVIDIDCVGACDHARKVVREINNTGRYTIEIRDASLGGRFPVVCAILYDRKRRGYVISMGSFPIFEVALDRTINELLQGQHIDEVKTVSNYVGYEIEKENNEGVKKYYEWYTRSNANNVAIYPDEFFGANYTYEVSKWCKREENDDIRGNKELFNTMCKVIGDEVGDKVLYKDYSFLGVPSYSIICPKIAIDIHYGGRGWMSDPHIEMAGDIRDALYGKDIDIGKIISAYEQNKFNRVYLNSVIGVPTFDDNLDSPLIKGYVEIMKGNYIEASRIVARNIPKKHNKTKFSWDEHMESWVIFRNYLSVKGRMSDEDVREFYYKIYSGVLVDNVIESCKSGENITEALFRDGENPLCVVDWEKYYYTVKSFQNIHRAKVKYAQDIGGGAVRCK